MSETEIASIQDVLKECPTGRQVLVALSKNGFSIKSEALGTIASSVNPEKKTITLNTASTKEAGALSLVHAASVLRQRNSGLVLVAENESSEKEVHALRKADALSAQLVFAEEMQQKNPKILETFIKNGNQPMYDAFKLTMAEKNNVNAARSAAVDCYLNAALPDKKLWPSTISKICKGFDNQSYYVAPDERTKTVSDTLYNEPAFNAVFAARMKQGR